MAIFGPPRIRGPRGPRSPPAPVAEGGSGAPWGARTPRRGLGMPPREPGLESPRPEEEAVGAVRLSQMRCLDPLGVHHPPPTGGVFTPGYPLRVDRPSTRHQVHSMRALACMDSRPR